MTVTNKSLHRVLIVGATNVGKSQLFNRLIGDRHSIVLDREGLTRDLVIRELTLKSGNSVLLIDSGGYSDRLEDSIFQSEINRLLIEEVKRANLIIFMYSKIDGIRLIEQKISKLLHKFSNCPVLLVANKIDSKKSVKEQNAFDFRKLGFQEPLLISAEHNINIESLRSKIEEICISKDTGELKEAEEKFPLLKLAIIGKVNVGKSSLVNALLNSNSIIVSPQEGTTVDLVEYKLNYRGEEYLLIDSPGWKKLKKVGLRDEELDHLSFIRAQKAIKFADILLFVVDLDSSLNYLDDKVAKEVFESNLPVIIVVNKWDLLDYATGPQRDRYEQQIRKKFYFLSWAPIVFLSSKYSKRLEKLSEALALIKRESRRIFSEFELNSFLSRANLFLLNSTKSIALNEIKQVNSSIPTFVIKCSNPDRIDTQQLRLIETQFRTGLKCIFSPIKLYYKKS
ncbi:GTP-binding protein EngA [Mycoplasma ovis str. Michigan]|uniref:GTPase Der n=1 Tax=Mycoplasma ovis str. Michigan TaxID=1415773 RepID=A0ABM5P0Q7_9MOLU|nr:ribosome biogenesis GTPase Der [Mycoplasma ovis]AHC40009.1 GTP-binding protein EngA [Mycoplasma ovis str. Michigan]